MRHHHGWLLWYGCVTRWHFLLTRLLVNYNDLRLFVLLLRSVDFSIMKVASHLCMLLSTPNPAQDYNDAQKGADHSQCPPEPFQVVCPIAPTLVRAKVVRVIAAA